MTWKQLRRRYFGKNRIQAGGVTRYNPASMRVERYRYRGRMAPDEVHAAVVAFLDQFIERGAARDVLDLRYHLVSDSTTRELLDSQLPNGDPTEREAFDGMRGLFAVEEKRSRGHADQAGAPDLVDLLSWTSREVWADHATADPAQWDDWPAAVTAVVRG